MAAAVPAIDPSKDPSHATILAFWQAEAAETLCYLNFRGLIPRPIEANSNVSEENFESRDIMKEID